MKTWTCNNFTGHYPVGTALVVTADDIQTAIAWVEKALADAGLPQRIRPEQLIPMPRGHRHVRILCNGDY